MSNKKKKSPTESLNDFCVHWSSNEKWRHFPTKRRETDKKGMGEAGKCVKEKCSENVRVRARYKVTRTAYCPSHDSLQYWNSLPCSATASSCLDGFGNLLHVPASTFYLQHPLLPCCCCWVTILHGCCLRHLTFIIHSFSPAITSFCSNVF